MGTYVTPFAGVWIEIPGTAEKMWERMSLPSRECGLKSTMEVKRLPETAGHSLRGSVD